MTRRVPMVLADAGRRLGAVAILALLALGVASCASLMQSAGPVVPVVRPEVDPSTLALWHLDEENGGVVRDAGPNRLDGVAGEGTGPETGVAGPGRRFSGDTDAFVLVPWKPALKNHAALTVEAWVRLSETPIAGLRTIAAQWTSREVSSSWYFGVVGEQVDVSKLEGYVGSPVSHVGAQQLLFAYVSTQARGRGGAYSQVVISEGSLMPGIWTHVAVTFDGKKVRFFRDHKPDWTPGLEWEQTQLALEMQRSPDRIRSSETPITIGSFFETFQPGGAEHFSYTVPSAVVFEGVIDEVRISGQARQDLAGVPGVDPGR